MLQGRSAALFAGSVQAMATELACGSGSCEHTLLSAGPTGAGGRQLTTYEELAMAVKPIPEGYHTVTPYLIVKGAARALEFYKKAFGAKELMRFPGPGDKIMHA